MKYISQLTPLHFFDSWVLKHPSDACSVSHSPSLRSVNDVITGCESGIEVFIYLFDWLRYSRTVQYDVKLTWSIRHTKGRMVPYWWQNHFLNTWVLLEKSLCLTGCYKINLSEISMHESTLSPCLPHKNELVEQKAISLREHFSPKYVHNSPNYTLKIKVFFQVTSCATYSHQWSFDHILDKCICPPSPQHIILQNPIPPL